MALNIAQSTLTIEEICIILDVSFKLQPLFQTNDYLPTTELKEWQLLLMVSFFKFFLRQIKMLFKDVYNTDIKESGNKECK